MDLTILNKKTSANQMPLLGGGHITVISAREYVIDGVLTQIRLSGEYEIHTLKASFNETFDDKMMVPSEYAIIDIEHSSDVEKIENLVKCFLPVTTKKVFIGDTDSISFATAIRGTGATYLHLATQLMQLGQTLKCKDRLPKEDTHTQIISVLGCKGGSGTSLIAWWLFQAFGKLSNLPVLLVQGCTGTPDLDLISDTPIQHDGSLTHIDFRQSMKIATEEEPWFLDEPYLWNYNLAISDHNVSTQIRDRVARIVPSSDFIFLVVTRELSSVRNAKLILDEAERITPQSGQENERKSPKSIIVLNELHPEKPGALSEEDISGYLGKPIDVFIPFSKDVKYSENKSSLYAFAAMMLGREVVKKENKKGRVGFSFIRALIKRQ